LPRRAAILVYAQRLITHDSSLIPSNLLFRGRECPPSPDPWPDPYMPENILVVEYEPRYTDRVRQALAGQPFSPSFAKDGEGALRALEGAADPRLIVLSSVVPKISATDLIRVIRNQAAMQDTPILL